MKPNFKGLNFEIYELVDKNTWGQFGSRAWMFLDINALQGLAALRLDLNKPITINNYAMGGNLQFRGFRPPNATVGASFSQHRFGRAFDINVKGMTPQEVYNYIVKNYQKFGITTIENIQHTPTWTHIDWRYTGQKELLIVNP